MIMIIKIMLISWFLTRFKPLQMLIDYIISKTLNNPLVSIVMSFVLLPLTCFTCSSFWIGLILTHNFWIAATASFIATWYELLFGWKEKVVKLN